MKKSQNTIGVTISKKIQAPDPQIHFFEHTLHY